MVLVLLFLCVVRSRASQVQSMVYIYDLTFSIESPGPLPSLGVTSLVCIHFPIHSNVIILLCDLYKWNSNNAWKNIFFLISGSSRHLNTLDPSLVLVPRINFVLVTCLTIACEPISFMQDPFMLTNHVLRLGHSLFHGRNMIHGYTSHLNMYWGFFWKQHRILWVWSWSSPEGETVTFWATVPEMSILIVSPCLIIMRGICCL